MTDTDSDEEMPLAMLKTKLKGNDNPSDSNQTGSEIQIPDKVVDSQPIETHEPCIGTQSAPIEMCTEETIGEGSSDENHDYDSDQDPEFQPGICEVKKCKDVVFAACPDCLILLCHDHISEDVASCDEHGKNRKIKVVKQVEPRLHGDIQITGHSGAPCNIQCNSQKSGETTNVGEYRTAPEKYAVEGSSKEVPSEMIPKKPNKQKEAKKKRNLGQEYMSVKTKKTVAAKHMKARCKGNTCEKQGKKCLSLSDEQRQGIFNAYHSLGDLRLQREYIVRHIKCSEVKRRVVKEGESRRNITKDYMFTIEGSMVPVCKVFFLNTLGVSEQSTRTALTKVTTSGIIEKDRRGGRQSEEIKARDKMIRQEISEHIDRFPKVESHYSRASTSREYLSPDLSRRKMYHMFLKEWIPKSNPPCFDIYNDVLKSKNLSIHRPKKDQCSLCISYQQGDEATKEGIRAQYEAHVGEKEKVREIKNDCKREAEDNKDILCASFDLQQVIYLPMSQEGAIFYKRRLSNYNLTFYNIGNRDCHCFTWEESQSKRGSSEISTAVYTALKLYDHEGIKKAYLFADGCGGQNKNSITPAMMLYMVSKSTHLEEVSLRFFETNHGQNEGDSAHSAIGHALKHAGNVFLPSQVATVMALARPQKPYIVHQLQSNDFLDFKSLSKDLRILDARRGSDTEDTFHWNSIKELFVSKAQQDTVFYKTSHHDTCFKALSLKRLKKDIKDHTVQNLNSGPNRISREKYNDLVALCSGPTPVVRLQDHQMFYLSLPHE